MKVPGEEYRSPKQILKDLENLNEFAEWARTKISNPDNDDEAFGGHVHLALLQMKKALKHFDHTYVNELATDVKKDTKATNGKED